MQKTFIPNLLEPNCPNYKVQYIYKQQPHSKITLLFLPGYLSNTSSTKAKFLQKCCTNHHINYLSLNYRGHTHLDSEVFNYGIQHWYSDILGLLNHLQINKTPLLVVGSSMGGWLGLLLSLGANLYDGLPAVNSFHKFNVIGYIGIAPAPDFTQELKNNIAIKLQPLTETNIYQVKNSPYFTKISHTLLNTPEKYYVLPHLKLLTIPTILMHGVKDDVVSYNVSLAILQAISSTNAHLYLDKNGDHRLCGAENLAYLENCVLQFAGKV